MSEERRDISPAIGLLTVAAIWDARLGVVLKDLGLTTRRYGLLAHVQTTPGISFSELARRSQITVQTAHTAVRSLVADGLVRDAMAHAGSASDLTVTEEGEAVLAEAERKLAVLDAELNESAPALVAALQSYFRDSAAATVSRRDADRGVV